MNNFKPVIILEPGGEEEARPVCRHCRVPVIQVPAGEEEEKEEDDEEKKEVEEEEAEEM